MLRKLAVPVLFSLAGVVAGVEGSWYGQHFHPGWFGWLGGYRYLFVQTVVLSPGGHVRPPGSRAGPPSGSDARFMVAQMRGKHPGVQLVFRGPRVIVVSASGSIHEGSAVARASREIVALDDGRAKIHVFAAGSELAGNPIEYGLLAGLGLGLGLVVPSRRRRVSPVIG